MKNIMPIISRLCVIIISILFYPVSYAVHEFSAINYDLTAEFLVQLAFLVLSAVLLGISIKIFPLKSKKEIVISIVISITGLVISFSLLTSFGVPSLTVFVCSVYITELFCRNRKSF